MPGWLFHRGEDGRYRRVTSGGFPVWPVELKYPPPAWLVALQKETDMDAIKSFVSTVIIKAVRKNFTTLAPEFDAKIAEVVDDAFELVLDGIAVAGQIRAAQKAAK